MLASVHTDSIRHDAPLVCLDSENPNRPVSLLEVLQLYAHRFIKLLENLQNMENCCASGVEPFDILGELLQYIEVDCLHLNLPHAHKQLLKIHTSYFVGEQLQRRDLGELKVLLSELHNRILEDLEEAVFFQIETPLVMGYFKKALDDNESVLIPKAPVDIFGETAVKAFPKAELDYEEACKCIVAGRATAAIFHLMRVAEHGLRALSKRLKITVTHSGRPYPLELADWETALTAIKNKIVAIRQLPKGTKKQTQLELYSDAADHCVFMKDIWRNNVSHTRRPYKPSEAQAALERVRDFMDFLGRSLSRIAR